MNMIEWIELSANHHLVKHDLDQTNHDVEDQEVVMTTVKEDSYSSM